MAPVNNLRTYGRSNKSSVNDSVEAINKLFARNKAQKESKKRKKKLLIKELPLRRGETLLDDDSLQVSLEDTFDKIVKGTAYNKVDIKSQISIVNSDSDASKSIKQVNSFYSPIMTRRRKKTASLKEISLPESHGNEIDSIPHFKEPTVEKIDISLEVEKIPQVVATSLSYIKVPTQKEGEVSGNMVREDGGMSKGETSFEPFFTRTFREKQMIHSSTPLIPMHKKEKIVNHTISPIRNMTIDKVVKEDTVDADIISMPKNSSTPIMSTRSGRKRGILPIRYRLQDDESSKMLSINHKGVERNNQPSKIKSGNRKFNVSELSGVKKKSTNSFITLRRRKVLKTSQALVGKSFRESKNDTPSQLVTSLDASEKESKSAEGFIASLNEFNAFENKMNGISTNTNQSGANTHNLNDFESFEARNKDILNSALFTCVKNTPANFITKRRRRLTDSCLASVKKPRILEKTPRRPARRLSLQEQTSVGNEVMFKEAVVMLSQINPGLFVLNGSVDVSDVNNQTISTSAVGSSLDSGQSSLKPHLQLKKLVVNLTRLKPFSVIAEQSLSNQSNSVMNQSKSLFDNSCATVDQSANKTKNSIKKIRRSNSLPQEIFLRVTGNSFSRNMCQNDSSLLNEDVAEVTQDTSSGRFNHPADEFEKYFTSVSAKLSSEDGLVTVINKNIHNHTSKLVIISNDVTVDKINDSEPSQNVIKQSSSLETNCYNTYSGTSERNPGEAVSSVEFQADKFEEFFEHELKTSGGDLIMPPNQNNSEVTSDVNKGIEEDHFEQFFLNMTKRSKSLSGRTISTEATIVNGDETRPLPTLTDKELIVNVTKSPWRTKVNNNAPATSTNLPVIDLTDLPDDEKPIVCNSNFREQSSSPDIIESSLLECSDVDRDGFRIPSMSNFKRRQSKTMLLKSGKMWRRSLSMFQRNSIVLNVMNEQPCRVSATGRYCNCTKCRLARTSRRISNRRFSVRIVPASPIIDPQREISVLENYAHNNSYVSDQILEDNLENSIRSLSLSKRRTSIIQNLAPVNARELVLRRCGQTEPLPFEECYPKSVLQNCQKIGEGVYGEVFLFKNPNGGTSVMKVIPIEGDLIVNGERQKKFEEILSEITIALELSNLRNNKQNKTNVFSEVQKIQCVRGAYPEKLLYLWDLYDETRGSENDSPEVFGEDQLYVVLQLANGGRDLEAFIFNNAVQAYTMFQQVACALAVAEEELSFEHRDLHWGNILLSAVDKNSKVSFRLDGKNYEIMTKGVEVAIIDFTLSRIECDGVVIFNDLSLDPELFTAEGDYQFEIYKLMQKKNGNNWQCFEPYSNVLWLHYTLDKAVTALRYKNLQTKIHKEYMSKLKQLKNSLLAYNSAKEFVQSNF